MNAQSKSELAENTSNKCALSFMITELKPIMQFDDCGHTMITNDNRIVV